jgi:hypothetical protein
MTSPGSRVWESRLPGSKRGRRQLGMDRILWHRRETSAENRENKPCPVAREPLGLLAGTWQ